ncbi:hypothetical protein [Mesorhizobium sp. IMUNJ 23232]|uniref:hypothetical protein n=1 Tax=Mesorhizobium sp. IMUNJ 23232 TaxID=3376064 RepID=UPI0037AF151C
MTEDTERQKRLERARQLNDQIEQIVHKEKTEQPPVPRPRSPRDFIHDRMDQISEKDEGEKD